MNVADYLLEKCSNLDKDFVVGTKETISYKELLNKVNKLASHLYADLGTGKEIMLLSENNVFFIVSYLSIIKSGNVVVLLDTKISENDLKNILEKCSISAFFVQDKFQGKLDLNKKICTEAILENLPEGKNEFKIETKDEDTAEIIFTSGSTGEKKGVMLTHKNIRANTESILEYQGLTENDRIEVVLPFFYCYGLSLLHTHLRAHGSIVLNDSIFLGSVINEIRKYHCTGFAGVPSTYQILINKTNFLEQDFPSLRYLAQAGGKLANNSILKIADAFTQKLFFVMYGATEATSRLSYLPPQLVKEKLGSIGKGISGVKLEVRDANGKPIKPNEVGEIVAAGDNITKGYYKDLEATNKVLNNGWYSTGDLATIDDDGFIYIVGRLSSIIKSAGFRITPFEIEDVVVSLDGVLNCAVMGMPDDIMGEAVIAVVEAKEPTKELKDKITSHCNRVLPSYKVPKNIVFIDKIPLNSSSKMDRNKIKEILMSKTNHVNTDQKHNATGIDYLSSDLILIK